MDNALCEENIIASVGEYSIFERYFMSGFRIGWSYPSPLRTDKNPSFNVFRASRGTNGLMWKDFATGDSGNVFAFVMKLYGLSYWQALALVNRDFHIGLSELAMSKGGVMLDERRSQVNLAVPSYLVPQEVSTKIEIDVIPWDKETLSYWTRYDLTQDWLEFYNIWPAGTVYVNDRRTWFWTKSNPAFAYSFMDDVGNVRIKVYRPLETNRHYKWLSNVPPTVLQGWEQYGDEKPDYAFLAKSLKDVALLRKLGWHALSLQAESTALTRETWKKIKPKAKNWISFYDSDETGRKHAEKLWMDYGIPYTFIPEEYDTKDISDFYEKYGEDESFALIDSII